MEKMETPRYSPRHESLRVLVALFFMMQAMGVLSDPGARALFEALLPAPHAGSAYAIVTFAAAWLILVGRHMQVATLVLAAITLLAMLADMHSQGALLRDAMLLGTLLLIGGFFQRKPAAARPDPGRVRLTRIAARCVTDRAPCAPVSPRKADTRHPFRQSPDDLNCLFDQIAEIREPA